MYRLAIASTVILVLLSACAGTSPSAQSPTQASALEQSTPAPSAAPPAPTHIPPTATLAASAVPAATVTPSSFIKKVDVGGYSLHILCAGSGSPTIVLDSGLGVDSSVWSSVLRQVKGFTRVCAYDRAGLGDSDPAPKPRTSKDMVADLHMLLTNANVAGPYVLVGWSIAGFNVRIYADQYPEDVVGMVLVDATHPDEADRVAAALPPESPNDSADLRSVRIDVTTNDPTQNPEGMDVAASAAQVRATKPLGALPLVVISHGLSIWPLSFPKELDTKLEGVALTLQKELASLSSQGSLVIAERSHHCIPCDQPDQVVTAIQTVITAVRKK